MGIGGVGSVTAEMLTRCGIGKVKHIQCNRRSSSQSFLCLCVFEVWGAGD